MAKFRVHSRDSVGAMKRLKFYKKKCILIDKQDGKSTAPTILHRFVCILSKLELHVRTRVCVYLNVILSHVID
jgi:hypothetical protein